MKTQKKTRIMAIAAFLATVTAGSQLWAQSKGGDWPAWDGKANADKKEWDEMGEWFKSAQTIKDSALQDMVKQAAGFSRDQKEGVKFWKKNKAKCQKALTAAQEAAREAAAKAEADKKAAEEAKAAAAKAANAKGVTAADFTVRVTEDGSGVNLSKYTGLATVFTVPADVEGLPVKSVFFGGNTTIERVTVPAGISASFGGCSNLQSVTLPGAVSKDEEYLFNGCAKLESVTLPKGVTKIGSSAFEGCSSLTSLTIPDSVTEIGWDAFSGSGIKELVIPDSVTEIGGSAFSGSSIKELVIPGSVTRLGGNLFRDSYSIERVTLSAGIKEIPSEMFKGVTSLKSVTLPAGLTAIGESAFSGSGIQSIVIPDSVTKIGKGAFSYCKNLTEVTLPKGLTELGNNFFDRYAELGSSSTDHEYSSPIFNDCSSLKRIAIPANVRFIGLYVFENCTALEEITFEGNTKILSYSFWKYTPFGGCENIKKLNAGPKVTKIDGVGNIPEPSFDDKLLEGLPLQEQAKLKAERADLKAAWSAFVEKYK